jgi:membrane protein YqaA with SNARE-associated domain
VSGFVPLVNGEVIVVGAALLVAPPQLVPLVLACACGQMLAKLALYTAARWSPRHLPRWARSSLERAESLKRLRGGSALLVLVSSGSGFPPFYLLTLTAGMLRVPIALFASVGFAGMLIRYSFLVWGATSLLARAPVP